MKKRERERSPECGSKLSQLGAEKIGGGPRDIFIGRVSGVNCLISEKRGELQREIPKMVIWSLISFLKGKSCEWINS